MIEGIIGRRLVGNEIMRVCIRTAVDRKALGSVCTIYRGFLDMDMIPNFICFNQHRSLLKLCSHARLVLSK